MKLPFDKVYCLHLAENKQKYDLMMQEYEKVGITDQVNIWWTVKRNISALIGNNIKSLHSKWYDICRQTNPLIYAAVFNCAFEHYTIVKQALLRGFDTILVFEDDIKFIDNIEAVEKAFTNLPDRWDVLKFCNGSNCRQFNIPDYNGEDDLWYKVDYVYKSEESTACYAFNRKAMEFYIECMDRFFIYADGIFPIFIDKEFEYYDTKYLVVYNDTTQASDIIDKENEREKVKINC